MKRSLIILSVVLLLLETQAVFARPAAEVMPEPSLHKSAAEVTAAVVPSETNTPSFKNEIPFLWSSGNADHPVFIDFLPTMILAAAGASDADIPRSIRNNKYFLESVRLTNLAEQAYEEGDYDASSQYSEEAVRYALLSDEFVRLQLKIKETDDAIAAARRRLDFAASVNAATRYPSEYSQAQTAFTEARTLRAAENWDPAIEAANRVLVALAYVDAEQPRAPVVEQPRAPVEQPRPVEGPPPLPAQYTVRSWSSSKDCLWNIAGRSWVYNDSKKWKLLYDANRTRMPQPDNPDLIHPDFILNIPSMGGEKREGMWDPSKNYPPLP